MNDVAPITAFESLTATEQAAVDEYVNMVEVEARRRGERVSNVLGRPIPAELVRRSRGMFLKPLVRAAIAQRLQLVADAQDIAPSRVIQEHAMLAFSNMADYITIGQFGELNIDIRNCTREQMAAIKSIETLDTPQGRRTKIQLYDKAASLQALQDVMAMPIISEPQRAGNAARVPAGADPEVAYTKLLEEMRPQGKA